MSGRQGNRGFDGNRGTHIGEDEIPYIFTTPKALLEDFRNDVEVRPKRPTVGKKKPGITFSETNHGRDTDPTNRVTIKSESAAGNHLSGNLPGSIVMRQKGCRLSGYTSADR